MLEGRVIGVCVDPALGVLSSISEATKKLNEEISTLTRRNGILQKQLDDTTASKQEACKVSEMRREALLALVKDMSYAEVASKVPEEMLSKLHLGIGQGKLG